MDINWGVFWAIMLAVVCYHFGSAGAKILSLMWDYFMGEEAREDRARERERRRRKAIC